MARILRALRAGGDRGLSTRKLQEAIDPKLNMDRKGFDNLLDALARAGYLSVDEAEFRGADGNDVRYRKVTLTHEGRNWDGEPLENISLRSTTEKKTKSSKSSKTEKAAPTPTVKLNPDEEKIAERLRTWRRGTAKELAQPAFCVFADRVLMEIAREQPQTTEDLLRIKGMGEAKVERWGQQIIALLLES